jgi:hypothetical protein
MTSTLSDMPREVISRPFSFESPQHHPARALTKEDLDAVLRALEIPFDANLVQWRVTEWSEDGEHGLMMPYADPRAYRDRLNRLLTPACWTRRYTVQASASVQRIKRGPAPKSPAR